MIDIDGKIHGAQSIAPDGQKFFIKGQRVSETFFVIGALEDAAYICEGYATGVSIHMATGANVVVTFNADNLPRVARVIKLNDPGIHLTVCGDDDRFTVVNGKPKNTGRINAEKAGSLAMAAVVFPIFKSDEGKPTDFNDLHVNEGIEAVSKAFAVKKEPDQGFNCLGYDDTGHYFYNIGVKDIFRLSALTPPNIFVLADESFWVQNYTLPTTDKTNYRNAANDLIAASLKVGRFDSGRVRGTGVWLDDERVVVNTGDRLIIGGSEHAMYWPEGKSIYVKASNKLPSMQMPMTVEECSPLLEACESLKWADSRSAYYLPGWIAVARIAGALPIRPHIWLTGGSATGKSTVMGSIIEPALGGSRGIMMVQGGTTEAGIRQTLRASSMPLIFDEFESTNKATRERHESIIELMRNSWSSTNGQIVKGSAGGISSGFNLAFAGLVSSIGVTLITEADRSRFSILELKPHGDDPEQWKSLKTFMDHITTDFGERLFARMVMLLPNILASYEIFKDAIARVSRQRMGQQIGMLMAGWWALRSDEVITENQAKSIAEDLQLREENLERQTEEMACLNFLMTSMIRLDEGSVNETASIEQVVFEKDLATSSGFHRELRKYGLLVRADYLYVAENHAYLHNLFSNTRWSNWTTFLRRLPGAERTHAQRFSQANRQRATKIPLSIIQ
jgi:ABC-type dipeptide/oligopeptide/nickel transport system ATPase subunit